MLKQEFQKFVSTISVTLSRERIEGVVRAYFKSIESGDIIARAALFSKDAVLVDPIGTEPKIGHTALIAAWQADLGLDIKIDIEALAISCNEVACLFTALISSGSADTVRIRTFENIVVGDDGLITSMRALFDINSIS